MKVALLQINTVTGDVTGNCARILDAVREAEKGGVDVCITPELALCGVAPGHFLFASGFAAGCSAALQHLAEALKDGPPLLVGAPVPSVYTPGLFSNVAVLIDKGSWQVVSRKVSNSAGLTPRQGAGHEDSQYFDYGISCGIVTLSGWRFGIVLCEEVAGDENTFWKTSHTDGHDAILEMMRRGVDAIVHMAALPFYTGVQEIREHMLSHAAAGQHAHLFYVNLVGGNDSCVYSGQSAAFTPTGQVFARGKAYEEDILVVDTAQNQCAVAELCGSEQENCWNVLTLGTRDFVRKCGFTRAVVGLSGGIDSSLVCAVAVEALGAQNVTGVLMPSPHSSEASLTDAAKLAENLGVTTVTLPIAPLMQAFADTLKPGLELFEEYAGDVTFENVQARIRGTLLTSLANRAGALVLNTGNKSECAMGYCTLYGDAVGALGVIADLTKTQVYAVCRWYNSVRNASVIPRNVFDKAPSAELRPGQKDSDSILPYDVLDPLLQTLLAHSVRAKDEQISERAREVRDKLFQSEFKRRQEPLGLSVSRSPFGAGWQCPVAGNYRLS